MHKARTRPGLPILSPSLSTLFLTLFFMLFLSGAQREGASGAETGRTEPATTAPVTATTPEPQPDTLKAFQASYTTRVKGFHLKLESQLSREADGSYLLSNESSALFTKLRESSHFRLKGTQLSPLDYRYRVSGLGRDRDRRVHFDQPAGIVFGSDRKEQWQLPWQQQALDRLSYQLQLRLDLIAQPERRHFHYRVAHDGKYRDYAFERLGEELLQTEVGELRAIRIQRIRDADDERSTIFWLARDWDFFLLRLEQTEPGEAPYILRLAEARLEGVPISGPDPDRQH